MMMESEHEASMKQEKRDAAMTCYFLGDRSN